VVIDGRVISRTRDRCAICDVGDLVQVVDLPKLPLTGIFLKAPAGQEYPDVDQALMLCRQCSHAQLRYTLDPEYVYRDTYTHRSSLSPLATSGSDFFLQFVKGIAGDGRFKRAVEIGCNDLYLLRQLEPLGQQLLGVDPIWMGQEPEVTSKIRVVGKFVEEIDLQEELGGSPDLILSAHTFEHLDDPKGQLLRLMKVAVRQAIFVLEVPSFDSLLATCRFDQVFHQHIQYFSLASFIRMVYEAGGEYLTHTYNYNL
jgi:hypothetical protein